jgi:hypothetical protein
MKHYPRQPLDDAGWKILLAKRREQDFGRIVGPPTQIPEWFVAQRGERTRKTVRLQIRLPWRKGCYGQPKLLS